MCVECPKPCGCYCCTEGNNEYCDECFGDILDEEEERRFM